MNYAGESTTTAARTLTKTSKAVVDKCYSHFRGTKVTVCGDYSLFMHPDRNRVSKGQ